MSTESQSCLAGICLSLIYDVRSSRPKLAQNRPLPVVAGMLSQYHMVNEHKEAG
ncbi:MAG: hypothetical protein P8H92_14760 [Paracoccaceae bacterium]|nr:hypothetical protein [Paracoccaceae bacterium]